MTLSEDQYITLIIAQVGGDTEDAILATNLPTLWDLRSEIADTPTRVLWVRLDAIDLLLGQAARQVDFRTSSGSQVKLSDLFEHFKALRELTVGLIESIGLDGSIAIGTLTKTAPLMPPCVGELDPNAQRYRGDTRRWRP